jgi:hypothetical protein
MSNGGIYYSPGSGRFHAGSSGQFVSNDQGVKSLIYDEEKQVYIDQRGRTVSSNIIERQSFRAVDRVGYDPEGRPFVTSTVRSRVISEQEAALGRIESNQQVVVRTVVTLPDGRVVVDYSPGVIGENIDPEIARTQAAGRVKAKLQAEAEAEGKSFKFTTNDIRNRTASTQFIKQTATVAKP